MNTEKFRADLQARLNATGRSVLDVCKEHDVPQASLSRFLSNNDERRQRGLNSDTVFALWPFVYGSPYPDAARARAGKI